MIVLDCDAAFAIAAGRDEGKAFEGLMLDGERIIAPQLFINELAHVARKYVRRGVLTRDQAIEIIREALSLPSKLLPGDEFWEEAFSEAIRLDHSPYDMFYFVLARRTGSTLFTLDKRLQELCLDNGVNCISSIRL